ncbi:hypothetical protein EGR_10050 [Echinococcus granulosus]|uniref:Uncharacterized protein n=1 Tax=Echinococcus granulosus TaxID=6210 RepID=W6U210_ECHGR|nr:hypothetical protein EGR_10050 [Echinococcus granulosus]EUB55083.1 hypothetical protein EGR_10050 [Echinococcus granulosus]
MDIDFMLRLLEGGCKTSEGIPIDRGSHIFTFAESIGVSTGCYSSPMEAVFQRIYAYILIFTVLSASLTLSPSTHTQAASQ